MFILRVVLFLFCCSIAAIGAKGHNWKVKVVAHGRSSHSSDSSSESSDTPPSATVIVGAASNTVTSTGTCTTGPCDLDLQLCKNGVCSFFAASSGTTAAAAQLSFSFTNANLASTPTTCPGSCSVDVQVICSDSGVRTLGTSVSRTIAFTASGEQTTVVPAFCDGDLYNVPVVTTATCPDD